MRLPHISLIGVEEQTKYYRGVREQYPTLPADEELALFEPVIFSSEEVEQHQRIQEALQQAVSVLISRYQSSEDLKDLIPLEDNTLDTLGSLEGLPFSTQLLRPDFVYGPDGTPYICEVNARFVFNGLYVASHLAEGFSAYGRVPQGTQSLTTLLEGEFGGRHPVLIKGREPDYDMFYYRQNNEVESVLPDSESIDKIREGSDIVLELHQDELARCIGSVANLVLRSNRFTNDPRTIFIAHDKRLLAALSDWQFMSNFIPQAQAQFLARHTVPTWVEGWRDARVLDTALGNPEDYITKGAISGKSEAYYDLRFMDAKDNANIRQMVGDIVIQRRIKQQPTVYKDGRLEFSGTGPITLHGDTLGPGFIRWYEYDEPYNIRGFSAVLEEGS